MADSFKTIDYPLAKPQIAYSPNQSSASHLGHHWCVQQAKLIAGCYRRDEAHDPEAFVSALALVLGDYTIEVITYAVDPRTGVAKAFPMGLPNIGQIREFCDGMQSRRDRLDRYDKLPRTKSRPLSPPKPPGFSYGEFLAMAARGEVKPRPVGYFEQPPPRPPQLEPDNGDDERYDAGDFDPPPATDESEFEQPVEDEQV